MPQTTERLGIIGLGLLGSALAQRLLAGGFQVAGYDVRAEQLEKLRRAGGVAAGSAAEVAAGCRRLLLSLPASQVVAAVLDEIESHLRPGAIIMDTTTGDPEQMAGFGARLARRGVAYLDATVGGSSNQVLAGEAIIICGGDPEAYARCADVFSLCARRVFHVGPSGSGARMKLVVNLVLGLNRAALAEGLEYARACGIDPAEALEVLKAGPAYSRVMDTKGPKMLAGDFTPEARLSQHLKDVRLILASGERAGARLPLSRLHRELLEELEAAGYGDADNSAIIKAFQKERDSSARERA